MHTYLQQGYEWIPTSSTSQHHPTKLDIYNHPMVIKGGRERRTAGDIYKRCGTARPTIPSERRKREEKSW